MKTFKEMLDQICEVAERYISPLGCVVGEQAGGQIKWAEVMMGFCFASAIQIASLWSRTHSNVAPNFDILSITILLSFASIFVSKYIAAKFRRVSLFLEQLGIFFAVTNFFFTITISVSKSLVITTWVVYAICFIVIIVCNSFF